MGDGMGSLRKCLNAATRLERGLKRGILDRAKQIAIDQNVDRKTAEVMAVKEAQSTAARDLQAVKAARAPSVAPTPGRGADVQAKVQQMMAMPEKRIGYLQKVRDRVVGLIAMNEAKGRPKASPTAARQSLEQTRQETTAELHAEERALIEQADARLTEKHGLAAEQARAAIEAATTQKDRAKAEAELRRVEREAIREKEAVLKDIHDRYEEKRAAEERVFTEQERVINARQRLGESEARRQNLMRALGEYNAILQALPPDVRGRVGGLGQLAHIGATEERLSQFLTDQLERVNQVVETLLQREFHGKINDLLKSYKPTKTPGGALKTRIGDAQEVVTEITRVSKLSHDEVAAEQASNDVQLQRTDLDADTQSKLHMKDNILQLYGDLKNRSASELEVAYETLQTTIQDGRLAWGKLEEARIAQDRALADEVVTLLGKGSHEDVDIQMAKGKWGLSQYFEQLNFSQLLEAIFGENSNIAKRWGTAERKAALAKRDFVQAGSSKLIDTIKAALGVNSNNKAGDAVLKMQKKTLPGRTGEPNKTSKLDAIYYRMAFEQKEVRERMLRQGWTQEHMDMLTDATSDTVSQAVYSFLRDEYERIYKEVDAVYHRQNGMHLPKIQFYSPMRYAYMGQDVATDPFTGMPMNAGTTAGFTIQRIAHNAEVKQMDAMAVYMQHLAVAAQYIHGSDLAREMRGVLNRPETKQALQSALGTASLTLTNIWMNNAINDGKNRATETLSSDKGIRWLTSKVAIGALALNPKTVFVQWEGLFRSFMMMGPRKGISALLSPNFYKNIKPMWKSATIQRRIMGGMNPVTQFLLEKNKLTPTMVSELTRYSLMPMILSDAMATTGMSALVYADQYNEAISGGKSEEEANAIAADAAEYAVYQYAQPIETGSRRARELKPDALYKMVFMFMTDPMMKTAMIAKGFHEAARGVRSGDNKLILSGIRKIGMVEVTALISQFIASAFKDATSDDDDDKIWNLKNFAQAAALAPFSGWFLYGSVASTAISRLMGVKAPYRSDPISQLEARIVRVGKSWDNLWDTSTPEEMMKAWDDVLRMGGIIVPYAPAAAALTNVAKPAMGAYKNLTKTEEEGFGPLPK